MEKETYDSFYKLEEDHWWFVGRRYLVFNFIDKYVKNHKSRLSRAPEGFSEAKG